MTEKSRLPTGVSLIIPRLFCRDPAAEIEFCKAAFDATELNRRSDQDGAVLHALISMHTAMFMIEAEFPSAPCRSPLTDGSAPVAIYMYVEDVDATLARALELGAKLLIPAKDQFWGDRTAWIMDPAGHVWTLATRVEDTAAEQRTQRWEAIKSGH